MGAAISFESVRFRYEDAPADVLRDLSIEIEPGEFVVIAGPSGEGKSTFCRTLNNIIPLFYRGTFSGKRWVAGEFLEKQPIASMARKVGMVFQDFEQQLFSTNAMQELSFGLENFQVGMKEMKERMEELLSRFRLSHLAHREPFSMSGGEKQKLAIASVLAFKPQILVLDEPTTDLDPESKSFVMQTLPELKDWVETVLIVDHETDRFQDADKIFLYNAGKVQNAGRPSEILTSTNLLEANSLAPLDLVSLQHALGNKPVLCAPGQFLTQWPDHVLQPIAAPARSSASPIVEVNNLSFQYDVSQNFALRDVSFEVRKGEFLGIIGQNGSGKSTLLRHLNGLQQPQKGTIRILGKEMREWSRRELSKTAGLVFQNPDHQIFNTTVKEEVEFGPRHLGFSEEQIQQNTERAVRTMDLQAQIERDPFQLSKGERQRVAVASVLSVNPEIVMLDEPTTGLDHRQQTYLMELLRTLNQEGATIIIVTHSLKLVGDYCNYAIVMEKGEKKAEGHPREIFFKQNLFESLPPLWDVARRLNGNALTVQEFTSHFRRRT